MKSPAEKCALVNRIRSRNKDALERERGEIAAQFVTSGLSAALTQTRLRHNQTGFSAALLCSLARAPLQLARILG